ncbi:MAG: hypothetical protein R3C13_04230 [Hyphomonas sp.]|uniref:hypothetical protein n=1 Tax=Hyphomonas sp. TaxID=87 RepID=UPI003528D429
MTLRRLAGLLLALLAGYLLWQAVHAIQFVMATGSPLYEAVMDPPTGLLRLLGTGFALIGGLLAFLNKRPGAWVAALGTGIFLLLTVMMVLSGAEAILWRDEAAYSAALLVLTGLLVFQRRH